CVLSIVGLIYSAKIDKAERAEQISESYFGYKILIPLSSILFIYVGEFRLQTYSYEFILLALFIGGALALYIIYKRTFRLSYKDWFICIGSIVIGLLLNILNL